EAGLAIARYNDLSADKGVRRLSLYTLDSYYYPVGTRGVVAPFALTALGLARVTEIESLCFFFQAEDGIRDLTVTGVQTCALPIFPGEPRPRGLLPPAARRAGHRAQPDPVRLPPARLGRGGCAGRRPAGPRPAAGNLR